MSDWSEHFLAAQMAMRAAEHDLTLNRMKDGRDRLAAVLIEVTKAINAIAVPDEMTVR